MNPPQNEENDVNPKRKFMPLSESLYEILRKLYEHQVITLLEIRTEYHDLKNNRLYNENEFYHFQCQKGHDTNRCKTLQHKIQNLIDQGKLEVDNPLAIPNQTFGPLPQHQANNVSLHPLGNQVTHKLSYENVTFIAMINITTRDQKVQGKQNIILGNQPDEVFIQQHTPGPQPPKFSVKGSLYQ